MLNDIFQTHLEMYLKPNFKKVYSTDYGDLPSQGSLSKSNVIWFCLNEYIWYWYSVNNLSLYH